MYEHQEYQSFPYQPAPNFKKYIPEPDSPAPVPMTEYMRPRIAYRPTAEQLRQAQYQAENAAAQSQANVEQVKINDEDGDLDQQQEQQRQEDFNQEPEADQAPAQRPLSQYAQYQAPQSRPRDILYDDDLEDSRLRQRDQYRRQKEREEREREARDREEQERQERDREEKVRQEREEQEREVQERELQEKERQVRERKARQERGQYLARERQLAAIREQRRLNGDQYRQEQEAPSAAARRPFDTKGASGQTGRGPVQQADREQYAEQLRSGPQLGDQAEEEGRDEREPESRPAAGMPLNLAYSRPVTQERQEGEEEAAAGGRPKPSYPVAQSAEKDSLAEGKDGHTLVGYLPLVHVPYPRPRYHLPQFAPAAITQKLIGSTKGDQDQYGRQATHRPADQVQQQQQQQQQFSEPTVPIIQLRKKKEKTVPLLTINLKQRPYASAA
ncbi:hypothetical protein HDE_03556 [Halotydeus destructor]|nr:hypothetical protein HDE_03556 [Halotydeus destructor]